MQALKITSQISRCAIKYLKTSCVTQIFENYPFNEAVEKMKLELTKIEEEYGKLKLELNPTKSKVMVFHDRGKATQMKRDYSSFGTPAE